MLLSYFLFSIDADYQLLSSRNVVKAFYSAGMLLDVCAVFGELSEDVAQQKKYQYLSMLYSLLHI